MPNCYFDNSATSFPKPPEVGLFIYEYLGQGGTYGRGAYPRVLNVSQRIEDTRLLLANLLGTQNDGNIVFTNNATHALNLIIKGFKYIRKRVLVSPLEHNAVCRPLKYLSKTHNVNFDILPYNPDGSIATSKLSSIDFSQFDLCIVNHVSNVNGVIQPIHELKKNLGSLPLLVDASQSAGYVDIQIDAWGIDFLAGTGHKGLMGPPGTGYLFVRNPEPIEPLLHGGTGSRSDSFYMPDFLSDKLEAGTPNILGIYGLQGALSANVEQKFST